MAVDRFRFPIIFHLREYKCNVERCYLSVGGVRGPGGGGGGQGGEFGEPFAGEEVAVDRGRPANAGGEGALSEGPSGQMRVPSAGDHRTAHILHRGAQGERQRRLPSDRRNAVGPRGDRRRLLGRRRGGARNCSAPVARSHSR